MIQKSLVEGATMYSPAFKGTGNVVVIKVEAYIQQPARQLLR